MLERDTGLELSRATLDGWVLRVGELLVPTRALDRRVLRFGHRESETKTSNVRTVDGKLGRLTGRYPC